MLSRVADSLYWTSRYLERAEHTARLVDINMGLMLDKSAVSEERRWQRVLAALGHPARKVRSRDPEGNDTEDWIYGDPPAKTVFVTFISGKVTKVEEFG